MERLYLGRRRNFGLNSGGGTPGVLFNCPGSQPEASSAYNLPCILYSGSSFLFDLVCVSERALTTSGPCPKVFQERVKQCVVILHCPCLAKVGKAGTNTLALKMYNSHTLDAHLTSLLSTHASHLWMAFIEAHAKCSHALPFPVSCGKPTARLQARHVSRLALRSYYSSFLLLRLSQLSQQPITQFPRSPLPLNHLSPSKPLS